MTGKKVEGYIKYTLQMTPRHDWCELESIINERVIEELEKYKSMMEEVRDGRRNHSFNDFIVGFGRTIEGLKQ